MSVDDLLSRIKALNEEEKEQEIDTNRVFIAMVPLLFKVTPFSFYGRIWADYLCFIPFAVF